MIRPKVARYNNDCAAGKLQVAGIKPVAAPFALRRNYPVNSRAVEGVGQ